MILLTSKSRGLTNNGLLVRDAKWRITAAPHPPYDDTHIYRWVA